MMAVNKDITMEVGPTHNGARLDYALREALEQAPWSRVRGWIESGKVFVDGEVVRDPGARVRAGQRVELRITAPKPGSSARLASTSIVFVDAHLVVVRKPPGVNSIPFEPGERGTLQEMVRSWLNRTAASRRDPAGGDVGVVHRIDKETSGLLVFTRTHAAKRGLDVQMKSHTVERRYLALAHGHVAKRTVENSLVRDRGDGVRGSTSDDRRGQRAVTHFVPVERLEGATLVSCRLETGRTHQVRIHLAESGHPLLGEKVYVRGLPGPFLPAPRLMLHAAVLGFAHPVGGAQLRFEDPMPEDMQRVADSLRKR